MYKYYTYQKHFRTAKIVFFIFIFVLLANKSKKNSYNHEKQLLKYVIINHKNRKT